MTGGAGRPRSEVITLLSPKLAGLRLRGLLMAVGAALAGCASVDAPRTTSAEYLRSWGLQAVNASPAYQAGISGRGVTVALIDCGLDQAPAELRRNVARGSVDLLKGQRRSDFQERHAAAVGGALGSRLDGR